MRRANIYCLLSKTLQQNLKFYLSQALPRYAMWKWEMGELFLGEEADANCSDNCESRLSLICGPLSGLSMPRPPGFREGVAPADSCHVCAFPFIVEISA